MSLPAKACSGPLGQNFHHFCDLEQELRPTAPRCATPWSGLAAARAAFHVPLRRCAGPSNSSSMLKNRCHLHKRAFLHYACHTSWIFIDPPSLSVPIYFRLLGAFNTDGEVDWDGYGP